MSREHAHRLRAVSAIALLVASALALGTSIWASASQADYRSCQAEYTERQAQFLLAQKQVNDLRASAAAADREAQDTLWRQLVATPQDALPAIVHYNQQRAEADAQRSAHPLPEPPPPPSQVCR